MNDVLKKKSSFYKGEPLLLVENSLNKRRQIPSFIKGGLLFTTECFLKEEVLKSGVSIKGNGFSFREKAFLLSRYYFLKRRGPCL